MNKEELKEHVPEEIIFKLPDTVKFPEVLFPDAENKDEVLQELTDNFIALQKKDVIATRLMDEKEVSEIRRQYGELAEEKLPELQEQLQDLEVAFKSDQKMLKDRITSVNTKFKDLVSIAKSGVRDFPLDMENTYRIPVCGHYLYYTWLDNLFQLALVQRIPEYEQTDIFNSGETNKEAFLKLGYELPEIDIHVGKQNVRVIDGVTVWEENGYDVWMEEVEEDYLDESIGEISPNRRMEKRRELIEDSPWRNDEENEEPEEDHGETEAQEGETDELPEEPEE